MSYAPYDKVRDMLPAWLGPGTYTDDTRSCGSDHRCPWNLLRQDRPDSIQDPVTPTVSVNV